MDQSTRMSALPSGIVTLLFSDIEGSTRLLRRLGTPWDTGATGGRPCLAVARSVDRAFRWPSAQPGGGASRRLAGRPISAQTWRG